MVTIDVGASTGGFTDVLLQRGAARVYAVDVGYGQIDWRLRQDPRVVVLDRTNIRYLNALPANPRAQDEGTTPASPQDTPSPPSSPHPPILADCAVIDVSFISLKLVLPAVVRLLTPAGWIVALIKPQFEAGAAQVGKGGVVRNPQVHAVVLRDVLGFATTIGLALHGLIRSPITGPAGNTEFLAWLGGNGPEVEIELAVRHTLQ
jgi:23S rRNA (cytidine1920-2'-O)/16S rRNA (cytidine1409-2'-O)-methyltransferase